MFYLHKRARREAQQMEKPESVSHVNSQLHTRPHRQQLYCTVCTVSFSYTVTFTCYSTDVFSFSTEKQRHKWSLCWTEDKQQRVSLHLKEKMFPHRQAYSRENYENGCFTWKRLTVSLFIIDLIFFNNPSACSQENMYRDSLCLQEIGVWTAWWVWVHSVSSRSACPAPKLYHE